MKIDCNVIRDLLPLYCENIASENSKELVEEHCKECVECRKKMQHMKDGEKVIEDNGKRLKKFMKEWKKSFNTLLAIYCYTLLIIIGSINTMLVGTTGALVVYGLFLFPIVGLFCNVAIASQKLKIKYVFPIICGFIGMSFACVMQGRTIEIQSEWFSYNFVPALVGFVIGIVKSKVGLRSPRKCNEGMIAGIVIIVLSIAFIIYNPPALQIMLAICIGGIVIFIVSFAINRSYRKKEYGMQEKN